MKHLLEELEQCDMEQAEERFGKFNTEQRFTRTYLSKHDSYSGEIAAGLEHWLNVKLFSCLYGHFEGQIEFSELVAQRYEPCAVGVGVHRDHKEFINVVGLLVIEGEGEFYTCDDRQGTNPQWIRNSPGDLILMRGAGLFGHPYGPFHTVKNITKRRITLGLRQSQRRAARKEAA